MEVTRPVRKYGRHAPCWVSGSPFVLPVDFVRAKAQKEACVLELVRYIHLNPVRARLVRAPREWAWSSHRTYLGTAEKGIPLALMVVLGQFHQDSGRARRAFARFVREGLSMGHRGDFYEAWDQQVAGRERFADETLATGPGRARPSLDIPLARILLRS